MNQPTSQGRRYSELDHVQERLIDIGTNPRDRAYASILGKTGMRISEAIQLKITDIDFQKGTITKMERL